MKMKKRLTQQQEFEVMKLVLDKFLWMGAIIIAYGGWILAIKRQVPEGISWIVAGALILIIFMVLIVREYEIVK
jgi:hypothetical protein